MKIFSLIGVIFFLVGLGMLGGAAFSALNTKSFINNAIESTGVVRELQRRVSRDEDGYDSVSFYPVVEYYPESSGESITFTSKTGSNPPAFQIGEEVGLYYSRDDYYNVRINSFFSLWGLSAILLFIGVIFSGLGGGFLAAYILKLRRDTWLRKNGRVIRAELDSVIRNYNVKVNGVSPYQLLLRYNDNNTGKYYTFKSDNIYDNPEPYLKANGISIINVVIDPEKPKRYMVDLSFLKELQRK